MEYRGPEPRLPSSMRASERGVAAAKCKTPINQRMASELRSHKHQERLDRIERISGNAHAIMQVNYIIVTAAVLFILYLGWKVIDQTVVRLLTMPTDARRNH